MPAEGVDYKEAGFPELFTAYTRGDIRLDPFFSGGADFSEEAVVKAAKRRKSGVNRKQLSRLLMSYNAPFSPSASTIENILSLGNDDVRTVTTGQQLSLFGGPLFTFYKVLTVIAVAQKLSRNAGIKVVPVFWLADEDHDYEEVRSLSLPSAEGAGTKLSLPERKGAMHPVSRLVPGDELRDVFGKIEMLNGTGSRHSAELFRLLQDWQPGTPWRKGFGTMLHRIFGRYGLVLAGSDDMQIKTACAPLLDKAIRHHSEITRLLKEQSSLLEQNFHVQAEPVSSHLFWHHPEQGRVKILFEKSGPVIPGLAGSGNMESLMQQIEAGSLWHHLSPNVFLRPVLQEYLLPNLAYAGGAAEIAYHAQMRPLFEWFGLEMPVLMPRLSATLIEPGVGRVMKELPFGLTEYKRGEEELKRMWIEHKEGLGLADFTEEWKNEIRVSFERRMEQIRKFGPNLETSAESSRVRIEKVLEQLNTKIVRASKIREEISMKRISRVHHSLYPEGVLQERVYGWVHFVAKYGEGFSEQILASLGDNPFETVKSHRIIYL